jgi:hypothetical protein
MNRIQETVLDKLQALSPEQQVKVLDFVESLQNPSPAPTPRKSLYGLWADFEFDITEEDIAEMRQEMWGNFPRDDF